jgi:hypothetical protein
LCIYLFFIYFFQKWIQVHFSTIRAHKKMFFKIKSTFFEILVDYKNLFSFRKISKLEISFENWSAVSNQIQICNWVRFWIRIKISIFKHKILFIFKFICLFNSIEHISSIFQNFSKLERSFESWKIGRNVRNRIE